MTRVPVSPAGVAVTIAAVIAVIAGLMTLGTPSRARERRLDELRTEDLAHLSDATQLLIAAATPREAVVAA